MFKTEIALIRRELLEHRSLYVVPAVLGMILVLLEITGHVTVGAFGKQVDFALLGATHIGVNERGALISLMMSMMSFFFILEMLVLTTFYALDTLYAERKDKSILFWRSLPVTDSETVISKLLTAIVVVPLITLAIIVTTHLLSLLVTSIWVGARGANAWHLIWEAVPLLDNWAATFLFVIALVLWLSPFVGWFLLVSAYTKRSPMLMALLPIIILPMLEKIFIGSTLLSDAVFVRVWKLPLFDRVDFKSVLNEETFRTVGENGVSLLSMIDFGRFIGSPGLWAGLVVCGLFTTAAIYVRRYRGES